jgi:hypothetical protein
MAAKGHYKTHCKWGHEMIEPNLRIKPGGKRECRACTRIKSKEWNKRHRDKYLEMHRKRVKAWREKNPEKARASTKRWQQTDKAKKDAIERSVRWRRNNPEKFKEQRRDYARRNAERIREWVNKYLAINRERIRERRKAHYSKHNPGPAIRRIARELKAGRIECDAAIESIRRALARLNGEGEESGRLYGYGNSGAGQGTSIDGTNSSDIIKSV